MPMNNRMGGAQGQMSEDEMKRLALMDIMKQGGAAGAPPQMGQPPADAMQPGQTPPGAMPGAMPGGQGQLSDQEKERLLMAMAQRGQ